jgi:hypothetical protein
MMIAAGAAAGGSVGMSKLGPIALRQGTKMLAKTDVAGALGPQVGEIVETIRGDLLDASKAAAATAVTSRLDSFSDNLHQRAETLRNPEAAVGEAGEQVGQAGEQVGRTAGRAGQASGRLRRRGRQDDDGDAQTDNDVTDYDETEEPEEDRDDGQDNGRQERGRPRRRSREDTRAASDEADQPEADEPADEYDDEEPAEDQLDDDVPADESGEPDEDAEEPAPRRRRSSRSPVARTGR